MTKSSELLDNMPGRQHFGRHGRTGWSRKSMEELLRMGLAVVIGAALIAGAYGVRGLLRRGMLRGRGVPAIDIAEQYELPHGRAGVIYLRGDVCAQCDALQEPALEHLAAGQRVAVRRIEAAAATDLARRFNIVTFPSTIVIGADRRVRSVNLGFADEETLRRQLA